METKTSRNVTDIIEIDYLQHFQHSLGRVTGITTAILDTNGYPVTQPTNLYAFCQMMQASESGVQMCMKTNAQLIEINLETRGPAIVTCPNSGLKTAAVPIFLKDEFLGSWLIGQMRTDEVDVELIEQTARAAGLSLEDAKKNISMLPVITEEEFQNILKFLSLFINEITHLVELNEEMNLQNSKLTEMTNRLEQSYSIFREFINLSDVGVYLVDYHSGELIMSNSVYAQLISATPENLIGQSCFHQMGFDDWCAFCPREALLTKDGRPGKPVTWENHLKPMDMWLRITSRAIHWVDGRLAIMTTFFDITDRKKEEERISYIAYFDQRLNIPNGMRLMEDVGKQKSENLYMICYDIQGLRKINDAFGREAGDSLMRHIKDWIRQNYNGGLQLYRVDGDEFALLVTAESALEVKQLAQSILSRFEYAFEIELDSMIQPVYVRVTMGVIPCAEGFESYSQMLNMIVRVLETARKQNTLVLFDENLNDAFHEHLKLELSLKECVFNSMKGFSLNYQPIVEPRTGHWVGVEALCRWVSPELGSVSPLVFIQEAEQLGLIDIIGDWVLQTAAAQIKHWKLDTLERFFLNVNLSPIQLNSANLHERITFILNQQGFPVEKLSLEVTESAEVHFDDHIMQSLDKLKQLGVSLSLDDFGTGYATFSNLNRLPVAVIKTDRSFMHNIESDDYLKSTMRIMIEFAHAAGMQVIAEGVETKEQMEILLENGVDYFQGYLFSRPLAVEQMAEKLDMFK